MDAPPTASGFGLYTFANQTIDEANILYESFVIDTAVLLTEATFYGRKCKGPSLEELSDYFTFIIYPDAGNKPAGFPGQEPHQALVQLEIPIHSELLQSTETPTTLDADITLRLESFDIHLLPGRYWFAIYFDNRFFEYSWHWSVSDPKPLASYTYDPSGAFLHNAEPGLRSTPTGFIISNFAFTLKGITHD